MEVDKSLIAFLEMLDTAMAQRMLADLANDEKRTPQLYNAINKLLDRHKFQIGKLQPDVHILGGLAGALEEYKEKVGDNGLTDDDIYTLQ
ncbi:terminase small subunit [Yersinia phage phiA1122]|uniref:DNA maturase A n=10 Tax=root TaxID=1 RepID=VDMA_BPT3|nr:DNA packaging protein, small subunit [Xylella fastidiosa]NP_523344.1 terminase small subunit [Enterobacteria phage T3]NP_848306.1 terminase small subunit [Yersinia phage phiA1122]YP_009792970.1 terminase small subunit [Enterobacteria phage T3]YP_009793117.1 terminase small subunit [Enterobacteria phage T7M]YP_009799269.1 terminase small subunit [Yersinia phage YpP-Y]YP_009799322.1 terminase small subunit [Yersinia phage YpsP-G]P10309.1 RecName: Full=DNA maturase A; AltName: Full=DNA-packa